MKFHVPACLDSEIAYAQTTWCGVEFYEAKIGAGKSHHVVRERVIPALREGRHVYTNINFGGPLVVGSIEVMSEEERAGLIFSQYFGRDVRKFLHVVNGLWVRKNLRLSEDESSDFINLPRGSRVVLDEVQNIFGVNKYRENPDSFFCLLTKCRKFDIDFVFITQNYKLVDSRIYSTATDVYRVKNLSIFSSLLKNGYRVSRYQSIYDRDGFATEDKIFDPDVFKLYKSSNSVVKHKFFLGPRFLLVPVLFGIFTILFISRFRDQTYFFARKNRPQMARPALFIPPPRHSDPPCFRSGPWSRRRRVYPPRPACVAGCS